MVQALVFQYNYDKEYFLIDVEAMRTAGYVSTTDNLAYAHLMTKPDFSDYTAEDVQEFYDILEKKNRELYERFAFAFTPRTIDLTPEEVKIYMQRRGYKLNMEGAEWMETANNGKFFECAICQGKKESVMNFAGKYLMCRECVDLLHNRKRDHERK